jgi:phage virion morphogenesis protein
MIEVEFDDREIRRALQNLIETTGDLDPVLREIGEILVESTKDRFSSLTGPDGDRWAANSPVTLQRKSGSRPLTGETGLLQDLIHYQIIDGDTLMVGSPLEYAAMQQFGGEKSEFPHLWGDIPARPFLGISESDQDAIIDTIRRHLEAAI